MLTKKDQEYLNEYKKAFARRQHARTNPHLYSIKMHTKLIKQELDFDIERVGRIYAENYFDRLF